jgi:EmrB/QacA subfamily drug resistance transporter
MKKMEKKKNSNYGGVKQVLAVSIGLFLVFLDSTVVNIALPNIINDYGITLNKASWVINAFVLTLAVLLITAGKLADIFGRLRIFLLGLIIFTISSFLCGIAPSVDMLILYRFLQGLGGAMVIPTSMMLVRNAVPPEKIGMAMGIWGAVGALAVAIGPSLGGLVTEYINWRWIFYINVPIVLIMLPYILFAFKGYKDVKSPFRFDFLGVILVSVSLYFLTYSILQGEQLGWTSKIIYLYFAISLLSAILFIILEKRVKNPLVDFTIFQNRLYLGGVLANLLGGLLLMGTLILLPIYLTQVKGYDTLEASLLITPLSAVMLVVAPLIGKLIDRVGYFIPMLIGYIFTVIGLFLLYQIDIDTQMTNLMLIMSILGSGLGILMVTSVAVCTSAVSEKHVALGSGIFATCRNIGGAIGVALFVSLTLSFLNANSPSVIDKGVESIEDTSFAPELQNELVSKLKSKENNFFEGNKQLEKFIVPQKVEEQLIAQQKNEMLKKLPEDQKTLPPKTVEKIAQGVKSEIKQIESQITDIQSTVKKDMQRELVNAMTKAFLAGLILSILVSSSLLLLRKKTAEEGESYVVSKSVS